MAVNRACERWGGLAAVEKRVEMRAVRDAWSNKWPEYRSTGDYAICWSTFFGSDTEQLLEALPAGAVDTSDYCYG
tara:strand:- start:1557 stop:1781 length:225 start_codon:yes stop_codon:yes gene_type:complete